MKDDDAKRKAKTELTWRTAGFILVPREYALDESDVPVFYPTHTAACDARTRINCDECMWVVRVEHPPIAANPKTLVEMQ